MQPIAALTAAALLAITQPFQKGLEAYKAGQFAEAAVMLNSAAEKAADHPGELSETARIWCAAARARAGEPEGVAALKSAYAGASNRALRELSFELWREAGHQPEDLAPVRSVRETVLSMQNLAAAGQIAQAEALIGPPLSDLLATWRRLSGENDSPMEMLTELPITITSAGAAQWPEGRSVVTLSVEGIIEVESEFLIQPSGWALTRILNLRHNEVFDGMEMEFDEIEEHVTILNGADIAEPPPVAELAPDAGKSAVSPEEDSQCQKWVDDLASPDISVRNQARAALRKAGVAAYPALRRAQNHPDPEISETVRELLP
ncbi:MAG: hypothetical protein KBA51_05330 [Kiritimatiellae bacterium]|nr:hypothetical protein [Kiritimatiellia bacterium]